MNTSKPKGFNEEFFQSYFVADSSFVNMNWVTKVVGNILTDVMLPDYILESRSKGTFKQEEGFVTYPWLMLPHSGKSSSSTQFGFCGIGC